PVVLFKSMQSSMIDLAYLLHECMISHSPTRDSYALSKCISYTLRDTEEIYHEKLQYNPSRDFLKKSVLKMAKPQKPLSGCLPKQKISKFFIAFFANIFVMKNRKKDKK